MHDLNTDPCFLIVGLEGTSHVLTYKTILQAGSKYIIFFPDEVYYLIRLKINRILNNPFYCFINQTVGDVLDKTNISNNQIYLIVCNTIVIELTTDVRTLKLHDLFGHTHTLNFFIEKYS